MASREPSLTLDPVSNSLFSPTSFSISFQSEYPTCDVQWWLTFSVIVIQGTADSGGKLSQDELSKTVDFCLNAFEAHGHDKHQEVIKKMEQQKFINGAAVATHDDAQNEKRIQEKSTVDPEGLSEDELRILKTIRARQMLRTEDTMSIDNFSSDNINGYKPLLKTGHLTLVKTDAARAEPKMRQVNGLDFGQDYYSEKAKAAAVGA